MNRGCYNKLPKSCTTERVSLSVLLRVSEKKKKAILYRIYLEVLARVDFHLLINPFLAHVSKLWTCFIFATGANWNWSMAPMTGRNSVKGIHKHFAPYISIYKRDHWIDKQLAMDFVPCRSPPKPCSSCSEQMFSRISLGSDGIVSSIGDLYRDCWVIAPASY